MGTIVLSLPTASTTVTAGLHSTNYSILQTLLNGNLDDANIKALAAIAVSKLAPGTNGQTIVTSGGAVVWGSAGAMTVIDDHTVAGSVLASYDTNARLGGNVPTGYKHLMLVVSARSDGGSVELLCQLNGDTAANYNSQRNIAHGAAADLAATTGATSMKAGICTSSADTAGRWAFANMRFSDYLSTAIRKGLIATIGGWVAAGHYSGTYAGEWASTAAITRILVKPDVGNFAIGSRFTLYGIG
jgi:hypothetical protein